MLCAPAKTQAESLCHQFCPVTGIFGIVDSWSVRLWLSATGQCVVAGWCQSGNPYDGNTLAKVIPAIETLIGNVLERIFASELQRDWAREGTAGKFVDILVLHGGGNGIAYAWEQQLLNQKSGAAGRSGTPSTSSNWRGSLPRTVHPIKESPEAQYTRDLLAAIPHPRFEQCVEAV